MSELSPYRRVHADPADWFDAEEIDRGRAYVRPIRRLQHVRTVLSTAVLLAFVVGDAAPRLLAALDLRGWVLELLVVTLAFFVADLGVSTWFDAWRELVWDKRWEMSTQTVRGFVLDQVRGLVFVALTFALVLPLWALIRATDLWWLYGWLVLAAFAVAANTLGPVLIAPMFNKYTPMEDPQLRERLLDVARTAELDVSEVLVADQSRRSNAINAHVAGLGKTRRVVVFDTLLDWPPEFLEQIIGHELGHWRYKHVRRRIPVLVAAQGLGLVLTAVVTRWDWVLEGAGVPSLQSPAALPLFLLVFQLGFLLTSLVTSWLSRADERASDIYALDLLRDPDAFAGAFRKLAEANNAEVDPPLWKRITHTHPPIAERVAMAARWKERNLVESPSATDGNSTKFVS